MDRRGARSARGAARPPGVQADSGRGVAGDEPVPAAVAGYPHLTMPMGQVNGLPVGISFFGTAWHDSEILALGYALEQLP